jgi:hypothetical protein
MNVREHHEGLWISVGACLAGGVAWFLRNIELINSLVHFAILAVTLAGAILGLRKVMRK